MKPAKLFSIVSKRLLSSLIVLFFMICFIFILLRLSPGNPVLKFVSPEFGPALAQKARESFGLDEPLSVQFIQFVSNIFSGDLGLSYNFRIPVTEVIKEHLPFTIFFTLASFLIQLSTGYLLVLLSIKKLNGFTDTILNKLSLVFYSLPFFVTGLFLVFVFSEKLKLLPASGLSSFGVESFSGIDKIADYFSHLILPLITLSIGGIAVYYKYLRDNIEKIFNDPWVLNLYSYGLSKKEIIYRHIIPNALTPIISVAGVELGILFSSALVTEVIFALPGMGRLTVNAILTRDYPLVVGCAFTSGVLIIISNLLADLLKACIDKRTFREMLN
jgi:peptide/nickel transport system permease protein